MVLKASRNGFSIYRVSVPSVKPVLITNGDGLLDMDVFKDNFEGKYIPVSNKVISDQISAVDGAVKNGKYRLLENILCP